MAFNSEVNPKAKTQLFKIYANVASASSSTTPVWELQGRGVESWSVDENSDINKTVDVLGFVDIDRGVSQPTQSGVAIKLRKNSKLAEIFFDAWLTKDTSKIDAMQFLQKFEFIDGTTTGTCRARLENDVLVAINSFTGEAGGYLGFEVDIHYSNNEVLGTMSKVDGTTITFTPDTTPEPDDDDDGTP